jgi:hypothetical protein
MGHSMLSVAGTGVATAAEEIDNDLFVLGVEAKAVLGFEIERVLFESRHALILLR